MPYIYLLEGQRFFDLEHELDAQGGVRGTTYRRATAWDGETFYEIPEDEPGIDLLDKWVASHTEGDVESAGSSESEQDPVSVAALPAPDSGPDSARAASTDRTDPDEKTRDEENDTTTEPPAQSPDDDAADVDKAPEEKAEDSPATEPETEPDAESSTSGTTRKRSAKNSPRRS